MNHAVLRTVLYINQLLNSLLTSSIYCTMQYHKRYHRLSLTFMIFTVGQRIKLYCTQYCMIQYHTRLVMLLWNEVSFHKSNSHHQIIRSYY